VTTTHQFACLSPIPARAGVGLKPDHYREILDSEPDIGWFEVHAENYMCAGGPPHRYLSAIRERFPLSLHGVGLSIGADRPLNKNHLANLKELNERYEPGLFSEHLAWSTHNDTYLNDLLPVPYNEETLQRVADHIDEIQATLDRQMLLENPSTYIQFETSTMSEIEFLKVLVERTGCGLLLDVNNVFVSGTNHAYSAVEYLDDFPITHVGEIHLGGHAAEEDDAGAELLIDTHNCEVIDPVWTLYERVISRAGPIPTLIEWDSDIPGWNELNEQAALAEQILTDGARRHAATE
jgi:hypothetical protein